MLRTIPPGRAVTFLVVSMGALLFTVVLALLVSMAEAGGAPLALGSVLAVATLWHLLRTPGPRNGLGPRSWDRPGPQGKD